jgi:hypothetical protein
VFRRVVSVVFTTNMTFSSGYFCPRCRWKRYLKFQALTMLLGWWSVLGLLGMNAYALLVNTVSLFRAQIRPDLAPAIHWDDFRAAVEAGTVATLLLPPLKVVETES